MNRSQTIRVRSDDCYSDDMSAPGVGPPLGIRLTAVASRASRAFDAALAAAGGTRPVWLILMSLKQGINPSQSRLANQIGIRGATLTHHLTGMEERGLVSRERQAGDRRNQLVQLTAEGDALFQRLRLVAQTFDSRLRGDLGDQEIATLLELLARVERNLNSEPHRAPAADDPHGARSARRAL